jgi:hypothetical protein
MGNKRIKKIRNREDLRQKSTIGIKNDMWPERTNSQFSGGEGGYMLFFGQNKDPCFHTSYIPEEQNPEETDFKSM